MQSAMESLTSSPSNLCSVCAVSAMLCTHRAADRERHVMEVARGVPLDHVLGREWALRKRRKREEGGAHRRLPMGRALRSSLQKCPCC